MREKGKTPENQLSKEEIFSFQEKDFRLLMLKMMQDIGSKRGYNSIICKKVITPKTYKNEKIENYNSDEGERKKSRETAK